MEAASLRKPVNYARGIFIYWLWFVTCEKEGPIVLAKIFVSPITIKDWIAVKSAGHLPVTPREEWIDLFF